MMNWTTFNESEVEWLKTREKKKSESKTEQQQCIHIRLQPLIHMHRDIYKPSLIQKLTDTECRVTSATTMTISTKKKTKKKDYVGYC